MKEWRGEEEIKERKEGRGEKMKGKERRGGK